MKLARNKPCTLEGGLGEINTAASQINILCALQETHTDSTLSSLFCGLQSFPLYRGDRHRERFNDLSRSQSSLVAQLVI